MTSILLDGSTWTAAGPANVVQNATVCVPSGNTADVNVRVDGGASQVWPKDTAAPLNGVDLSRLEFSGTADDRVVIVGSTRYRK
ncbi:MAG: hypothetical protein GY778_13640 [bacterium]|nr:hypothetical protein [bacterium]